MRSSSGPTWFMGEMTPWSTWYTPWYSRERSMATTSLGSATTHTTLWSRLDEAQMAHRPSPSVRFWQTGQQPMLFFASSRAAAKSWAVCSGWSRM